MANVYACTDLIGGGAGALDTIDGSLLSDLDAAMVTTAIAVYNYSLDADSGLTESSPDIIAPDTNPGTKRWILVNVQVNKANIEALGISHTSLTDKGTNTHAQIDTHVGSTSNPHSVTKTQVSLGNVPNLDTTTAVNSAHTHANSAQLALVSDGDHDVRTDNPHSVDQYDVLPSQTSQSGKYLYTNGSATSWQAVSGGLAATGIVGWPYSMKEYSTTSGTYVTVCSMYVYVHSGYTYFSWYVNLKSDWSGYGAYFRFAVGSTYSGEISRTTNSYAWVTGTACNVSALSGWYLMIFQLHGTSTHGAQFDGLYIVAT